MAVRLLLNKEASEASIEIVVFYLLYCIKKCETSLILESMQSVSVGIPKIMC